MASSNSRPRLSMEQRRDRRRRGRSAMVHRLSTESNASSRASPIRQGCIGSNAPPRLSLQQQRLNAAMTSNQQPTRPCTRSEMEAEDDLFETIERLIDEFLTRPGRRVPYTSTTRWTVHPGNVPDYTVVVTINQSSSPSPFSR